LRCKEEAFAVERRHRTARRLPLFILLQPTSYIQCIKVCERVCLCADTGTNPALFCRPDSPCCWPLASPFFCCSPETRHWTRLPLPAPPHPPPARRLRNALERRPGRRPFAAGPSFFGRVAAAARHQWRCCRLGSFAAVVKNRAESAGTRWLLDGEPSRTPMPQPGAYWPQKGSQKEWVNHWLGGMAAGDGAAVVVSWVVGAELGARSRTGADGCPPCCVDA